jgi:hypothetical protein
VYGQGTYFAKVGNFLYSAAAQYAKPDAHGYQRFILANVAEGRSCRGTADHVEPPKDAQGRRYDTTCDNDDPNTSTILVVRSAPLRHACGV